MQLHVNEGYDNETATQMKDAIESHDGVPGVVVTLVEVPGQKSKEAVTWDGVSYVNNI